MRILVVEDDATLADQIGRALDGAGYATDVVYEGGEARFLGGTEPYDAVVLDLGLPDEPGLEVLAQWREDGVATPVLILSARGTWRERVQGLRAGADDYLAKPFAMEELQARLEALVRRAGGRAEAVLTCGPVELDPGRGRVTCDGAEVTLTAMEFRLLAHLMHHPGQVLSKTALAEHIYGQDLDPDSNTIEVMVNRLRRKLGRAIIETRRGYGYRIGDPA